MFWQFKRSLHIIFYISLSNDITVTFYKNLLNSSNDNWILYIVEEEKMKINWGILVDKFGMDEATKRFEKLALHYVHLPMLRQEKQQE